MMNHNSTDKNARAHVPGSLDGQAERDFKVYDNNPKP